MEDKQLLLIFKIIYKIHDELRAKYIDRLSVKNKKLIHEFHNYRFDISETIKHA